MAQSVGGRKAKGRRCAQEAKDMIHRYMPHIPDADIVVTSSGDNGPDLKISSLAASHFPFAVECKNQEKINIWDSINQSGINSVGTGNFPLLIFKRNRTSLMCCLPFNVLLFLLTGETCSETLPESD